jgi:hypothetical protein
MQLDVPPEGRDDAGRPGGSAPSFSRSSKYFMCFARITKRDCRVVLRKVSFGDLYGELPRYSGFPQASES